MNKCYIVAYGPPFMPAKCRTLGVNARQRLALLQDEVAIYGMVRHTMDIIDQVHKKLKLDQPLVITADQPVCASGKQVQWLYPDEFGDHKVLMIIGPLHIEIDFLNLLGNWLETNG